MEKPVAGLFVIATPYWGADSFWKWDEAQLPQDAAARLANIPRIFFYHNRDDEVVPFAHLAWYESILPQAELPQVVFRAFDAGGHQFNNDLSTVAEEISSAATMSGQ